MTRYTPAETALKSGFTMDTLRYYEKIGLLADIDRTSGGRRAFTDDDLGWLGVLRCLRDTGMPIAQMCRYAELARGGEQTLPDRLALLQDHARGVEEQMQLLSNQYQHLLEKISGHRRALSPSVEV
ncbi:MAG TPA: MerR family transcriptional regulator [Micromonosporaceae bacterium]|nr:MerR family transcriptional regulator [Micromonosporaceae bacterium]